MRHIVEVNDQGALTVPPAFLGGAQPQTRYVVEVEGDVLVLRPERVQPFWEKASSEERVAAWQNWPASHPEGVGLPDEALRRESLYRTSLPE